MLQKLLFVFGFIALMAAPGNAQQSVARQWNEALIQAIREDFARPPVHARNLFYTGIAMYDAWAAYDTTTETYFLGKTVGNYTCAFDGVPVPADIQAAREEAMSFAVYRLLTVRFQYSPNGFTTLTRFQNLMTSLGYDFNNTDMDYQNGSPAALGNYLGSNLLQMGYFDGSNELFNYSNFYYQPVNPPMVVANPGAPTLLDPNRWQPLTLATAIDQNGNPIPSTQVFQSPEWGNVRPFALDTADLHIYTRNNNQYWVYHDPGAPPFLDTISGGGTSDDYRWNFALVAAWSAQLDPFDGVMWDISPRSIGNVQSLPLTQAEYRDFYDFQNGLDPGIGRDTNPRTGQPYQEQLVPRGDYTRVLAQFWADGPTSETPPGHWFTILNHVSDDPDFVKKFHGQGPVLDDLEWDVKAYFTLGAAMHDAAISAWGIKGWYDGTRPITALRYMAELGQSTDPGLPHYHPAGLALVPGLIELVDANDPLAGPNGEHVNKIKFQAWLGYSNIANPATDVAGVGWILAENWLPYQRSTFVTPPFAGYISGHSTFSRSAAEVLTLITGDEYFPGGMGEFHIPANSGFLGLEAGPSVDVTLQWATYRDASDQTSLSRIWGGIHPPFDDIPGRLIGIQVGNATYNLAKSYFYKDNDGDGFYSFEDCDDQNPDVYPNAPEMCDGIDNDCNGLVDDMPIFTYYLDSDGDGFGNELQALDTCLTAAPIGYAANSTDCDDQNPDVNPNAVEMCDGIDNDCNGLVDDMPIFTYYLDSDGDGFGNELQTLDTCLTAAPVGYAANSTDCDDQNPDVNPNAVEMCDGIDNDCNGLVDDMPIFTYYLDSDGDGFGDANASLDTCLTQAPVGYVTNNTDCDDGDENTSPAAQEICDEIDNDCDGLIDNGLETFIYFIDSDGDGYGADALVVSCLPTPPMGLSTNDTDCNDSDPLVNPGVPEILGDGIDNDCDGLIDDMVSTSEALWATSLYPNPASDQLTFVQPKYENLRYELYSTSGQLARQGDLFFSNHLATLDISELAPGVYFFKISSVGTAGVLRIKLVKI